MRLITRVGTTASAAVIAVGGFTFVGAGVAEALHGHCGYPPGQCRILFDQSSYFPGNHPNFTTDKAFKRGEEVKGHADCAKGRRFHIGPYTANDNHRVNGSFRIPKPFPKGTCSVKLTGQSSGWSAYGSFFVKHHHHATSGLSGQSSGGARVLGLSAHRSTQGAALSAATTSGAAAAPSASSLPFSGSAYTIPMSVTGALLLLSGGGLLMAVRRRRHANGVA